MKVKFFKIAVTGQILKRISSIAYNTLSLCAECKDMAMGYLIDGGACFHNTPEMLNLESDEHATKNTIQHCCEASNHQVSWLRENAKIERGNAFLDVHTHMSDQKYPDGRIYCDYKNPSGADIEAHSKLAEILNPQGIAAFAAIVSVDMKTGEYFIKIISNDIYGEVFYVSHLICENTIYKADSDGLIKLGNCTRLTS